MRMNGEYIEVGRVCISRAGHDKGSLYVAVGTLGEDILLMADGVKKTLANPKKKKRKHVKGTAVVLYDIAAKLPGSVYDHQIAKALEEAAAAISHSGKEG